jgi:cytochrome c oxidase subunit IV
MNNPTTSSSTRATLVWLLLIVLTLATYAVGKAELEGFNIAGLLLLSVFIKGHFVIADFMSLRNVKRHWRFLVHGWLIFIAGMIGLAYEIGVD